MKISFLRKWISRVFIGVILLIVSAYLILSAALYIEEQRMIREIVPGDPIYVETDNPQKLKLISGGIESLRERVDLIRSAEKSIELEFFIYNVDRSSRLVTQELIKKAREGVQVRLLIDFAAPVLQFKPVYADFLRSEGIQLRYYNTSSFFRLMSVQHRSHRKLLIVDGNRVLTGGRNIADEYFDLAKEYNFLDSDILIEGSISEVIQKSFDFYWDSKYSENPADMDYDVSKDELLQVQGFFKESSELESLKERLYQKEPSGEYIECNDSIFVTDYPGVGPSHRKVYDTIIKLASQAKKEIVAESPYFVLQGEGKSFVDELPKRGIKFRAITNSLNSTDAYYTVSHMYPRLGNLKQSKMDLHLYKGKSLNPEDMGRWGLHSKRAVIDEKTTLIGTYNIDPRSANLNSELMYVCRDNPELAQVMLEDMKKRFEKSWLLIKDGEIQNRSLLTKDADFKQKVLFYLTMPIANLFAFLL
jgi:putative cardiolipin synthase